jgi:hypothetical protein
MNTITYELGIGDYMSRDEVLTALAKLNLDAQYISVTSLKGKIVIKVPDTFSLSDAMSLGAYVGQIQTMKLAGL